MDTKFKGISPHIGFLEGDIGRRLLKGYNKRVEADYRDNSALRVLNESNGLIKGSNPFAVVLANQVLREEELRTATQADLEEALRINSLDLGRTYEDIGLVLRGEADPNSYLARDLSKQLRARGSKFRYPVLVNLKDLTLRLDADSNYGLAFTLRDDADPIYASVLNQPSGSRFNSSDIDKATGLPTKTGEGERCLYTRDSGLSRLYLYGNWEVDANLDGLAYSSSGGRVVVVSDAATQKIKK